MNKWIYIVCGWLLALLAACSDEDVTPQVTGTLDWQLEAPELEAFGRYYAVETALNRQEGEAYLLTTDADWLTLTDSILPSDGLLDFKAETNDEAKGRTAVIRLEAQSQPDRYAEVEVYQKGVGDDAANADDDTYRVGYSYDAFSEYESPSSLKAKVIDMNKLAQFDKEDGFQSVQQATLGREDFEVTSAASLRELSYKLTKKMDQTSNVLGIKKTVKRYSQVITSNSLTQHIYAYSRMSKVVSTQSLDAGALQYVIEKTEKVDNLPFTSDFLKMYKAVINNKNAARTTAIKSLLNTYGTHLVTEASLGGMIDYIVTFDRAQVTQLEATSEYYCKKVFGKEKNSSVSETYDYQVTSDISNAASVQILGGDATKRTALTTAIKNLSTLDDLPEKPLNQWFQTINESTSTKNLSPVDFKLIPISDLFADATIRNQVLEQVIELQAQSNNTYSDQDLGTDNYQFDLTSTDFQFTNTSASTTSLVKIVYVNSVPVMEVCEEYVPKLRQDSRVKVFYPIYNGMARHAQGLFPGDGQGNRPAYLSFYEGEVYVTPIDSLGYYDKVTTAYYLHGNLYHTSYGTACQTKFTQTVKDELMTPAGWTEGYAVVKIGSGYWTRQYIKNSMKFGALNNRNRFEVNEYVVDDLLFANIYRTNASTFLSANKKIFGPDLDASYGEPCLWYLPLSVEREHLTTYLGNNLKALFKGQVSGFDAQFEGCYGAYNESNTMYSEKTRRNQNLYCYIAFKENSTANTGEVLKLTKNYKWATFSTSAYYNYYPVKLFRTAYFVHQNL